MLRIIPNKNNIGAEIDTDLQKLSRENFKIINKALNKYGMIFFRKQTLVYKPNLGQSSCLLAFGKVVPDTISDPASYLC